MGEGKAERKKEREGEVVKIAENTLPALLNGETVSSPSTAATRLRTLTIVSYEPNKQNRK